MADTRILIIDDDRAFRIGTGALLADEGYAVDAAPGEDEGSSGCARPATTWSSSTSRWRAERPLGAGGDPRWGNDVPVLMLTGFGTVDTAVQALKLGADDYITKPCDNDSCAPRSATILARREPVLGAGAPRRIVATGPEMREVLRSIARVAPTESTVLLRGATGTGKELIARAIHEESPRRGRPFVAVNCSALAEGLLESELFGHARGAFTGAVSERKGLFEEAPAAPSSSTRSATSARRCRPSCCASSRSARSPASARPPGEGGRARDRRHAPGPRGDGRGGPLPRRPLLPPQGLPDPHPRAARADRTTFPRSRRRGGALERAAPRPVAPRRRDAPTRRRGAARATTGRATSAS
jgi:CheY-like chemotaxis protein